MTVIRTTFLVTLAAASTLAPIARTQEQPKLTARELFYAEATSASAAPARTAPSAPKPATAQKKTTAVAQNKKPPATTPKPVQPAQQQDHVPVVTLAGNRPSTQRVETPSGVQVTLASTASSNMNQKPLGLRYSLLKESGGDYREVDVDSVFRSGDRIRISVEANDSAHLYVVMKGTSGSWKVLFPSPEISEGSNQVDFGRKHMIPPAPGRFTFDGQAGEERLFIVLSRQPEQSLESLIYSLGSGSTNQPISQPADDKPRRLPMLMASIDNSLVDRLRGNVLARDLVFEKVDEASAGEKKEKAMYVVNSSRAADSRLVADLVLKHQ